VTERLLAAGPGARWPLACFLALGAFWGSWAACLPALKVQTAASDGELGLALVAIGVGALPGMLASGRLWQRFGWWLLPAAAVAFALAALGPIVARDPPTLGVLLLLVGAGSGALDVAMNSAVSDVEVAANRRLMYGAHALFSLAVLVASVASGLAREAGAGPAQLLPLSTLVLLVVAAGSATAARHGEAGVADARRAEQAQANLWPLLRAIAGLATLCMLAFLIEDALQNWSALLLETELGAQPAIGGAAPGIFAGAMFIGRSSGQWLGARYTDRSLLSGGAVVAGIGLLVTATASLELVALAGLAAAGAGVALVAPALFARAGRAADAGSRGAAISALTIFGYSGFVIGPMLVGLVAQAAGLRVAIGTLALLAGLLALGGLTVLGRAPAVGRFAGGEELLRTGRG
jgi:MFS family permease